MQVAQKGVQNIYCNPLPLPHFQRGRASFKKADSTFGWMHDVRRDFREMADPTVVYFDSRWWLFPSAGMLWVSDDLVHWEFHRIEPFDPGYAPTVVVHPDGWLYLTACCDRMWRARHPLGPWEDLGQVIDEQGKPFRWSDPMLFVDDDGQMYCYHGLGKDGIYVAKMKRDALTHFDGPRQNCFPFNPEHLWERKGEYNQDPTISYIEGAWMTKHAGVYYLQYSGNGTEWRNYGLGCYRATSPLGPWAPQAHNPILLAPRGQGIVNGCAHHSVVTGPDASLWCFYTCLVRVEHAFERRIGMDPVHFDENGDMYVAGPTETPQAVPAAGASDSPTFSAAEWLPLTVNQPVRASAYLPGHEPVYAVDDSIRTRWEAPAGAEQWLTVDLQNTYLVQAARTIFGDRGLDYETGVVPAPYRYFIECSLDGQAWSILYDASANASEQHIRFDLFEPKPARHLRLRVVAVPPGMTVGVAQFTAFGKFQS